VAVTKTRDGRLADATSELTRFFGVKSVFIAAAAAIDELEAAISGLVIVPN